MFCHQLQLNNFGYLKKKDGKFYTYVNTEVKPEFVCDLGVDWLALSFVQTAKDIIEAKKLIKGRTSG